MPCLVERRSLCWIRALGLERGIRRRELRGRRTGWYFQRSNGRRAKLKDYDDDFRSLVKDACAVDAALLPPSVDIDEDISLWRSLWRGSTTEVGNQGLPPESIDGGSENELREQRQR